MRRLLTTRATLVAVMAACMMVITALNVTASDGFADVPNSNQFHDDINWMASQGITGGCGGANFCPTKSVTRGQMAAFMHRFATVQVVAGGHIDSTGTVNRWFDHVSGAAPTVDPFGTGEYDIDLGWTTVDAYAVCTVDNNAVAARDAFCTAQMLGAGGLRIRIWDTGAAAHANHDFMYLVYGLDM